MKHKKKKRIEGTLYWIISLWILILVMALPTIALGKVANAYGPEMVLGYFVVISGITVIMYRSDKQKAQLDSWRTPESRLHFMELAGGWAAGFLAQRIIRHKISKRSYQFTFWFIGILHNLVSFDYMKDWEYSEFIYQLAVSFQ